MKKIIQALKNAFYVGLAGIRKKKIINQKRKSYGCTRIYK